MQLNIGKMNWFAGCSYTAARRATQNSAQPGYEFARIERLGKIVISAQLQTENAIKLAAARRQHQHRHGALLAKLLEDVESAHAGQHYVQYNNCILIGQCFLQSDNTIVG